MKCENCKIKIGTIQVIDETGRLNFCSFSCLMSYFEKLEKSLVKNDV
jgi:hypothetical protein